MFDRRKVINKRNAIKDGKDAKGERYNFEGG